jgi:hypothetical protein
VEVGRAGVWEWLTGLAGFVLLLSLFLPWYGLDAGTQAEFAKAGDTMSAWEAFRVDDALFAFASCVAFALVLCELWHVPRATQWVRALCVPLGYVVAALAALWLAKPPRDALISATDSFLALHGPPGLTLQAGAWIGMVAAAAMPLLAWQTLGARPLRPERRGA